MNRTKIDDRQLPNYTRSEEIFNMVTHIVGGSFGIVVLALCISFSLIGKNYWGLAGGAIYGLMMIFLYTVSSVYHGLKPDRAKKVMQVLDHCTIYALILGTYAPILLTGLRAYNPRLTVVLSAVIVAGTAVGVTFTAVDFKRYRLLAYGGYFTVGWCIIFAVKPLIAAFCPAFFLWLLAGGVVYTLGMIFFTIGIKKRYFHSIFHIFIVAGSVLQFIPIFQYCIITAPAI
ncbi:MAG: hemolysin III family protein [Clostridia bacterium]|nr:hemolysin III family protein [Clostridia bacterium]